MNTIHCVLAGQKSYYSCTQKSVWNFFFTCFSLFVFFFSLWASSYHPWQFGIRNFLSSYLLFGSHVVPSRCIDVAVLHIAWGHFQSGWINTIALKLQLLAVAQAWQCRSMGFVTSWVLYLIIWVTFVNWWLIIEKQISKIVMVKQYPVEFEAVMRKFNP